MLALKRLWRGLRVASPLPRYRPELEVFASMDYAKVSVWPCGPVVVVFALSRQNILLDRQ